MKPTFKWLCQRPLSLIAFGFGAGLAPKAPGTIGTLVAIPFYFLLVQLSLHWYSLIIILGFFLGIYICGKTARELNVPDHPGIVWDEIVGYWITLFALPVSIVWIIVGFLLFRLLDILKPPPIRWIEKKCQGGIGIMLDDVLAGMLANLICQVLLLI